MLPTVRRDGPSRFFVFLTREEMRMHVHVAHPADEANFWLVPMVSLAVSAGLSAAARRDAEAVVERHLEQIRDAWIRHSGR